MSDSLFTIHRYIIPFKKHNEPIYLIPFGDVHRFAPLCHVNKWKEFLEQSKNRENIYFIGMGDYDDIASSSERDVLRSSALHETTKYSLNEYYKKRTEQFVNEIGFMKDRLIGMIEGNHHVELESGITSTQYMCELLGVKYLGVNSFIRIVFKHIGNDGKKKVNFKTRSLDLWAHHGTGAARKAGNSINKVQEMINTAEADIFLMGHDHHKSASVMNRMCLTEGKSAFHLINKKVLLARTGTFLMGYKPGEQSYVAKAGYSPSDIGVVEIKLTPKRQHYLGNDGYRSGNFYIDIHASI